MFFKPALAIMDKKSQINVAKVNWEEGTVADTLEKIACYKGSEDLKEITRQEQSSGSMR